MGRFIEPLPLNDRLAALGATIPAEAGSFVNGERRADERGEKWNIIYPATGETASTIYGADEALVEEAANAARAAFETGPWRRMSHDERKAIFFNIADAIEANAEELAVLQTVETGISFAQIKNMHVPRSAQNFRFFAEIGTGLAGETYQQTGKYISMVLHEPIGVGAVIAPWNAPIALASMKVAACLIVGNSCIIKPSEYTPLALLRLAEIIEEAGLPKGVLHLINGSGRSAGAALVANPHIGAINFVGGTETGKAIMAAASQGLKKVGLELGGKSANIILDSANLENAIDGSLLGIFAGNGEQCLAGSRILVQRGIADQFIPAFVERAANLTIGDPFEAEVELGPLAFKTHMNRVLSYVDTARDGGDEVLTGGARPAGAAEDSCFIEPIVAQAGSNAARICQEEIFGPFASLIVFDELDEAIAIANDSEFGLVSYVWSDDLPSVMKASQAIEAGTVWVNTPMVRDLRAPFGGYKNSGIGRDGLPWSIELFTEQKTVILPAEELSFPKLGLNT